MWLYCSRCWTSGGIAALLADFWTRVRVRWTPTNGPVKKTSPEVSPASPWRQSLGIRGALVTIQRPGSAADAVAGTRAAIAARAQKMGAVRMLIVEHGASPRGAPRAVRARARRAGGPGA